MDKKKSLFITFLLMSCAIFSQKSISANSENSNTREERIETIVSFTGDFSIDDMKIVREKLSPLGITYLGYCVDQKCMIVSMVKNIDRTGTWLIDKISALIPGKVKGTKDYEIKEYVNSCQLYDQTEAAFFKNRIQQ